MSGLMKTLREDRGLTQNEPVARVGRLRQQTIPDGVHGPVRPRLRQRLVQRRYPHHV